MADSTFIENHLANDESPSVHVDTSPLKDSKIIFVVGGPGSGKVSDLFLQIT